jgi:hypothetical protein
LCVSARRPYLLHDVRPVFLAQIVEQFVARKCFEQFLGDLDSGRVVLRWKYVREQVALRARFLTSMKNERSCSEFTS